MEESDNGSKVLGEEELSNHLGGDSNAVLDWKNEALAVIKDVQNHVKLICIAEKIKVMIIYTEFFLYFYGNVNTRSVIINNKYFFFHHFKYIHTDADIV